MIIVPADAALKLAKQQHERKATTEREPMERQMVIEEAEEYSRKAT